MKRTYGFTEVVLLKIQINIDLNIILLHYQNNYVEDSSIMSNAKKFWFAINLIILYNYFELNEIYFQIYI